MSGNKIVIDGSINTDMVIKSTMFPKPGETILGDWFLMNQGGKGANQVVAVALSEGLDIGAAFIFDNKAAEISVTRMGAQLSLQYRNEIN